MRKLKILLHSNAFYLFFFLFIVGYVFFFTGIIKYHTNISKNTKEITAKILSFSIDGDKLSMIVKEKEKISATYYIQSEEEKRFLEKNLKLGGTLKLTGEEKESIGKTIPNTFDYKKYLYREKIYFCFGVAKIEIIATPTDFINKIKNLVDMRIKSLGNHPYLRAFILGDKTRIDSEQYESILENGVSHLFALSGMHLSLLYLFFSKILGKIKYKKIIIYLFLFLYLGITGVSISFLRAILFMLLLDINKKMDLSIPSIKILLLCAFLILILNPFSIYNVGFWYTFIVTFSLLFCNSLIKKQNKIGQVVLVSIVTFLFSLPISIYLNYEINLLSILNNILLVPFISVLVFPFALFSFLFPLLLPIFHFLVGILEKMNLFFVNFSIPIIFGKINLGEVLLYYILLILGISLRYKKIFAILFVFLLFLYNKNLFQKDYSVYFIDVGQGDACLFVAPKNKEVILIDTGGSVTYSKKEFQIRNREFNLADNIVLFLKSIRVRKIDLLLITHGDKDHLGYASDIGKSIPFRNIMINQGEVNNLEEKLIEQFSQVDEYHAKYFDFQTYFLKLYNNENDNSILTKIKIEESTFLMMGDASSTVERDFMGKYDVSATFLKLGHHGSNTSSSYLFLKEVNPEYAIVSAGRNNIYHHPSKETIENLNLLNIPVLNTQEMGTIEIKINKGKLHIKKTLA